MKRLVLAGIKVVDFSWAAAGPLATKYLADNGAKVVRIETETRPDMLRTGGPFKEKKPGLNRSGAFALYNANKFSMALNLNHPTAKKVTERLVAWGDIVAESFSAGVMEKLGLGFEELKKIKPNIILFRSSAQGQTGPHSQSPATGLQLTGLAGFTHLTGWADRPPCQPWGAYTDFIGARYGALAMLAALIDLRRTGKGQCIDLSQYEASLQFLGPAILDYVVNGRIAQRDGNRSLCAVLHGVYQCQDNKWCAISVSTKEEMGRLCKILDIPLQTEQDELLDDQPTRQAREEELNKIIEEKTMLHCAREIMELLQDEGIPAGVVQSGKDIYECTQLKERNQFWQLTHNEIGSFSHLGQSFILSETPPQPRLPSPCLGEHTEFVCKKFLRMPDKEFVRLVSEGLFR